MAFRKIPINLASEAELRSLPGIGPRTARAVIEYRETVGQIDEHNLANIPYIRISRELLDLIDFSVDGSGRIIRQQAEIDQITDAIDRANLRGPSCIQPINTGLSYPTMGGLSPGYRYSTFAAPPNPSSKLSLSAPADTHYSYPSASASPAYPIDTRSPWTNRLSPEYRQQRQSSLFKQDGAHYNETGQSRKSGFGYLPKTLVYDGKSNWRAFYTKFSKYAESQHWSAKECKDNLCWCMTGKANDFFANIVESYDNLEFFDIVKKFEKRFGYQDLPETATVAFNTARQEAEEDLDDWADRVMTLATKAFRDLPEDYMYKQAILRFCHGCNNKEAGEQVANFRPPTMEVAVDKVKWAIHTHNAVHGRSRRDIRQVSNQQECPEYPVYTVKQEMQQQSATNRLDKVERSVETIQGKMDMLDLKYDKLMAKLDKLLDRFSQTPARSVSPSPSRSPSSIKCFRCQGNHLVRDCPEPKLEQTPKKVQFVDGSSAEPLNAEGSDGEGQGRPNQ